MSRSARAGKISIDLSAGTAQFVVDMERANSKLNSFGSQARSVGTTLGTHTVSGTQAASAAIRALGGDFTHMIRPAEQFLAKTLGLGNALKVAFPVIGALALGGVVEQLIGKAGQLYEAWKKVQEAPGRIAAAFEPLHASMGLANADLQVANDRLANEIAKLEHKPTNGLKLALDEAIASSMKLSENLQRNLAEGSKILTANKTGFLDWFMGKASNKDVIDRANAFQTGLRAIERAGQEAIRAAGGDKDKLAAATTSLNANRIGYINKELTGVNKSISDSEQIEANKYIRSPYTGNITGIRGDYRQQDTKLTSLREYRDLIRDAAILAPAETQNEALTKKKDLLTANAAPKVKTDVYAEKMQEFGRELDAANAKASRTGDVIGEALARGMERGQAAVDQLTASLKEQGKTATTAQRFHLIMAAQNVALAEETAQAKGQNAHEAIEARKRAFEEDIQHLQAAQAATEHLDNVQNEADAKESKRLQTLRGDLTALHYADQSVYGSREDQFRNHLAGIQAKGRELSTPTAEINEQVERAQAEHAFELRQMGVGQTASEGFKQFFTQMQDNARSTGAMVQQTLGSAFEGVNDTLSAIISGQKASWASFFQSLSAQFAKMGLQQLEVSALGALTGGGGGFLKGLASIFGGFRAGGGDIDPGKAYVVGENGPEALVSRSRASIIPNKGLKGSGGALYYIDARGANEAAVEQRVQRALVAVHGSAVRSSTTVNQEMMKRRPRGLL